MFPCGSTSGIGTGPGPFHARPMPWRMNENPIAVISGASRGWLRSGLYPIRSIATLIAAQKIIVRSKISVIE